MSDYTQLNLLPPDVTGVPSNWHYVTKHDECDTFLAALPDTPLSVDLETEGLRCDRHRIKGIGICDGEQAWYTPWKVFAASPHAPRIFDRTILGHNIKFDLKFLVQYGMPMAEIIHDTMVLAFLIVPWERQSLDHLATVLLELETWKVEKPQEKTNDELFKHCCGDVWATYELYKYLNPLLGDRAELYAKEMELIKVLTRMELHGMYLDIPRLKEMQAELQAQSATLQLQIYDLTSGAAWNINSLPTLRGKLMDVGALPLDAPKELTYETLSRLDHPLSKLVLEYRAVNKLCGTYVEPLVAQAVKSRIRCAYKVTGTRTGRLASGEPNLMNIPNGPIRECFISPEGAELLIVDYSQIEIRVFVHYSSEPTMLKALQEGQDLHTFIASMMFGVAYDDVSKELRKKAKAISFGLIYGGGAGVIARSITDATGKECPFNEAQALLDQYFTTFSKVKQVQKHVEELVRTRAKQSTTGMGYVKTFFGQRRYLKPHEARIGLNSIIQGSAGLFVSLKMIDVDRLLAGKKTQLIANVHDELVFEYWPEEDMEAAIVATMEDHDTFAVPLVVDAGRGRSWEEAK
jgi:DNA polymerase-1